MGPGPIVAVDEGGEGGGPLPLARVGARVLPLLRERPVHALHLAVLPGAVGPGVPVRDAGRREPLVEQPRAVSRPVVGHHALDLDAEPAAEAPGAPHERGAGLLALVAEQLGAGHAAAVVDRHVQAREPAARAPAVVRRVGSARPPAPAVGDPRDLLDVDVHELAGPPPLVAARGRGAASPGPAGHAVDVGQARQAVARDDPGAGAGGHPGLDGEGEGGEQAGAAALHNPRVRMLEQGGLLSLQPSTSHSLEESSRFVTSCVNNLLAHNS